MDPDVKVGDGVLLGTDGAERVALVTRVQVKDNTVVVNVATTSDNPEDVDAAGNRAIVTETGLRFGDEPTGVRPLRPADPVVASSEPTPEPDPEPTPDPEPKSEPSHSSSHRGSGRRR